MKSEDVAEYLMSNPDFFNEHADLLSDLQISHPQHNKVISLHERQILALRDKNKFLQDKLLELIGFGEENDAISEKLHRLTIALLMATHFNDLRDALSSSFLEDFSIPHYTMRLWDLSCVNMDLAESAEVGKDIRSIAESLTYPYCGSHVADTVKELFGEAAAQLQSFSMIPLNTTRNIGLLVLGSPELERFYADMGTLHLKRLGELIAASITRFDLPSEASESSYQKSSDERRT